MCKMKDVCVGTRDLDFTFENMPRVCSVLDLLKAA